MRAGSLFIAIMSALAHYSHNDPYAPGSDKCRSHAVQQKPSLDRLVSAGKHCGRNVRPSGSERVRATRQNQSRLQSQGNPCDRRQFVCYEGRGTEGPGGRLRPLGHQALRPDAVVVAHTRLSRRLVRPLSGFAYGNTVSQIERRSGSKSCHVSD